MNRCSSLDTLQAACLLFFIKGSHPLLAFRPHSLPARSFWLKEVGSVRSPWGKGGPDPKHRGGPKGVGGAHRSQSRCGTCTGDPNPGGVSARRRVSLPHVCRHHLLFLLSNSCISQRGGNLLRKYLRRRLPRATSAYVSSRACVDPAPAPSLVPASDRIERAVRVAHALFAPERGEPGGREDRG
ncbi:uncharacterized protein LOC143668935 [Tamandua tetradactyla]|uniref:uncharacterized protein LOC143668935 n=1 Tax=Tamandua tetradactyla TaxID=48850 RepID=UPI004054135E